MPAEPTVRLGLVLPLGGDSPPDIPADHRQAFGAIDRQVAIDDQGTHSSIPSATAARRGTYFWAQDRKVLYRCTGTEWLPVGDLPAVSALPSMPDSWDGMRVQWAPPESQIEWSMVRRGALWRFVGGSPIFAATSAVVSFAPPTEPNLVWITPPAAGVYDVRVSVNGSVPTAGGITASLYLSAGGGGPVTGATLPLRPGADGAPLDQRLSLLASAYSLHAVSTGPVTVNRASVSLEPVTIPVAPA